MGAPEYAAIILDDLCDRGANIALVVTSEDKPVGRDKRLTAPPVKVAALKRALAIAQPRKLDDIAGDLAALKPDLIVVAAYGQMIGDRVLAIAPCLNLHASLLPKYRGASPIQAALLNGDRLTGLTLMAIGKKLDSGATLGFAPIETAPHNLKTLTVALAKLGAKLILSAMAKYDSLNPIAQQNCGANMVKKIKKEDGLIDFNRSAAAIERAFRAYYGWPNIYLKDGLQLLELTISEPKTAPSRHKIGEIIAVDRSSGAVTIACETGAITIAKVKPSGKNAMSAVDYINGRRLGVGDTLS
jgi:methionyl-tRNA formyltransferase